MMWFYGKSIRTAEFPNRRVVIRFRFSDETGPFPRFWLVAQPGLQPELCVGVPDFDIDLFLETTKKSLNAIFLGRSTVSRDIDAGRLFLTGDAWLSRTMDLWFPRSIYAGVEGIRMLPAAG